MVVEVQTISESDREWVREFLWQQAGNTRMVSRGVLHHCDQLPGFIGSVDGVRVGLVTVRLHGRDCEVVTLYTAVQGHGVGTKLLEIH
ncbi:MAG: hypothetical protein HC804_13390 [Anaerolineae bacterium]|nr:hypothetical protein [Anaerolineae bacterium]